MHCNTPGTAEPRSTDSAPFLKLSQLAPDASPLQFSLDLALAGHCMKKATVATYTVPAGRYAFSRWRTTAAAGYAVAPSVLALSSPYPASVFTSPPPPCLQFAPPPTHSFFRSRCLHWRTSGRRATSSWTRRGTNHLVRTSPDSTTCSTLCSLYTTYLRLRHRCRAFPHSSAWPQHNICAATLPRSLAPHRGTARLPHAAPGPTPLHLLMAPVSMPSTSCSTDAWGGRTPPATSTTSWDITLHMPISTCPPPHTATPATGHFAPTYVGHTYCLRFARLRNDDVTGGTRFLNALFAFFSRPPTGHHRLLTAQRGTTPRCDARQQPRRLIASMVFGHMRVPTRDGSRGRNASSLLSRRVARPVLMQKYLATRCYLVCITRAGRNNGVGRRTPHGELSWAGRLSTKHGRILRIRTCR